MSALDEALRQARREVMHWSGLSRGHKEAAIEQLDRAIAMVDPRSIYGGRWDKDTTLRDYFIAHAPAEPQPWFKPKMPTLRPQLPPFTEIEDQRIRDDVMSADATYREPSTPEGVAFKHRQDAAEKAQREYDRECDKQVYVQWPVAWADEMLRQREIPR